jgi:tyrosine-protein kinase Etk/Wzc
MEDQVQQQNSKAELTNLNIKELFFKYVRFLPLFIICIAFALIGAFIYLRYSTEIYRSTGSLLIQSEKETPIAQDKLEQVMMTDRMKNVQTEIEVLQSRPLIERVVNALNLNFNYYVQGNIKEVNIYKFLPYRVIPLQINDSSNGFTLNFHFSDQNSFKIDDNATEYKFNQEFKTPAGIFKLVRFSNSNINKESKVVWNPTIAQANAIIGSLDVIPKQNTGMVTLSMESTNPDLAADVINALMKEYSKANIEDKNITTNQQLDFIDREIKQVSHQLDSINDLYVAFRKRNNLIDPGSQSTAFLNRIEESNKKLNEQKILIKNAVAIEDYLKQKDASLIPASLGLDDPVLKVLIEDYNKAQVERKALLGNAPSGNIIVQQKNQEVDALKTKVAESVRNIKQSFGTVVGELSSNTGQAMGNINTMPEKERGLLDIQRDLESKALIYNSLLTKKEEAAIALASTISNTKILQDALSIPVPVKPNRNAVRLLALIMGILVPVIIIIIIELLNDKITSRNDIEKLTDATILGEVGHSFDNENLVVTHANRKVIAEQFRILRSNLQYVLRNTKKPVILVTSSFSGEGKSFISTNVGAVIALTNKKTIILEFDIRKPKVLSHLSLPKRHGLSNYLLGKVTLEDLPMQVPGYEHLFVLPCGPLPPNPAEILLDPKLNELFAYLKENFDVVVMDTAPVGMVSDAMTLSRFADCTLYIVRQGHTYKKQIGLIDEYHKAGRLPKLSLVINDVKVKAGYGYYGYGRYGYGNGYGYGYGSGYFEDDKKTNSKNGWFTWLGKKNGVAVKKKKINR